MEYYRRTNECVSNLAAEAAAGNATYPGSACVSHLGSRTDVVATPVAAPEGGVSLLLGLGSCLTAETNAFLYHNESCYLRFPLPADGPGENGTMPSTTTNTAAAGAEATVTIAGLVRYAPDMPPRPPAPPGGADRAWIVYVAVALVAAGFAVAGVRTIFRRKRASMAFMGGAGGGAGGGGSGSSLFSSSAGAGWRSGGGAGSDFGEFDGVGGGYEGNLFPGDSYGSGRVSRQGLSSSSRQQGKLNWRGARERSDGSSANTENVELKRPLLHSSVSPLDQGPDSRGTTRGGLGDGARGRSDRSAPPFARMHGTIGAGPSTTARREARSSRQDGGSGGGVGGRLGAAVAPPRGSKNEDDRDVDRGPFGDDPFVGGGGGDQGGSGASKTEPEGDEVFC